jgi:polyhydroxyalkanoate synthase
VAAPQKMVKRLNKWTKGHIPLTGAVAKQMVEDFVIGNKLVKGKQKIRGKKVDLANITANLLVVSNKFDRLVPQELIVPVMELVSSKDKTYHLETRGHANPAGMNGLPDYLKKWLHERSMPLGRKGKRA